MDAERTVAVIQARMGSSRLPGKVLLDIAGRPMLEWVWLRTSRAACLQEVVVATTQESADEPVAAFCSRLKIPCVRGSQFDVLDRFHQAAECFSADRIVRITADCPLIDPQLIDATAGLIDEPGCDFAANRLPPPWKRTFPIGLDVEVCRRSALQRAWQEASLPAHREHVMPYLYEGAVFDPESAVPCSRTVSARGFSVAVLNHTDNQGGRRWTVDTSADLEFVRAIYERFHGGDHFGWLEVLELVQREPDLNCINAGVRHKRVDDYDERFPQDHPPSSNPKEII